jgi:phosphate transport system substrate-binding protein
MKNNYSLNTSQPAAGKILSCSLFMAFFLLINSCTTRYFKNDYEDNSPTSGKLKVYYDEGLELHVKNQAFTFQAHYPNAHVELFSVSENAAVEALYNDSCKDIVISRLLNEKEKKAFESKNLFPKFSAVAKNGVALITNINTPVDSLTYQEVIDLLTKLFATKEALSGESKMKVLFDKKNSAVMHYLLDSLLKGEKFSGNCVLLGSTLESINYVAQNKNTIAFIDFAWLSDQDDSISKANKDKIKLLRIGGPNGLVCEYPSPNSFKLGTYPFTRTVYVLRRSGEFTLGKGFETFVAGPNGQNSFLKQGLLPTKQQERSIRVNMEPLKSH